jgi:hypothetical protein
MQSDLMKLFYQSEKGSTKWEKYFPIYEQLLSKYKNKAITFVEIGVLNGGSLDIWKKFFGENSRIIGIDKNPECKKFQNKNFEIFIGSQSDPDFWRSFYQKVGNVDVILDDGGHTNNQQVISLVESLKYINDDGIYITEDVHTSYLKRYGNPNKYSFINFSKKCIDDINCTFPKPGKFDYSINKIVYAMEYFESIVTFKVNRNLCNINKLVVNKGTDHEIVDVAYIEDYFNFQNKYPSLYKFKFVRNILRLISRNLIRLKSNSLKDYFH